MVFLGGLIFVNLIDIMIQKILDAIFGCMEITIEQYGDN
jgi:hypothetical protein